MHAQIAHEIPEGWRICGENLYARHSIAYEALPSYFMMFSIWDSDNRCLDWDDTLEWSSLLKLETVPILYDVEFDIGRLLLFDDELDTRRCEGYVVRLAESFAYDEFDANVAK